MAEKIVVKADHIEEIKAVIKSGDVDLAERRAAFQAYEKRPMTLDEAGLIAAIALTDDDDEDLFVNNVKAIEERGWQASA